MTDSPEFEQQLARHRAEIDAVDERIIALLKERCETVKQVGILKGTHAPGRCPIRPGREAQQVRQVVKAFAGSAFDPAAAAVMWRMMIMASLKLEGSIRVSVCTGEGHADLYWIAREYFGPFSLHIKQPTPKRVIGDVLDGKAAVGVLPPLQAQENPQARWWMDLFGGPEDGPKIFAWLPFVHTGKPGVDYPVAMAVGRVTLEQSGDDMSYLAIEADEMASQHRLQQAFAKEKLEARWIEVVTPTSGSRIHLVEVKGFITRAHEGYKAVVAGLSGAVRHTAFLGSVAAPLVLAA